MASSSYSRQRSYRFSGTNSGENVLTPSKSLRSAFDEQRVLARSGTRILSSMPDLLLSLEKSGTPGPKALQVVNLHERAEQIGRGSQFTVFKARATAPGISGKGLFGLEGLVVKRIKVSTFRENGRDLVDGHNYRRHLMSLELEIIALCHPSIRKHRNIVNLIAWGHDYVDPQTPLPVLFVEAASCTLDEFLDKDTRWEVKHQISLDIASGLEILHRYRIVHGDMKPENILVFPQQDSKVPFIAKLSDFGLCIDLYSSVSKVDITDYLGTPDWNAPELKKRGDFEALTGAPFTTLTMLKFDAYSYGLVVVSLFCNTGKAVFLSTEELTSAEAAIQLIRERVELPSNLKSKMCSAIRGLLDDSPFLRPLPCPSLLSTDELISYQDWMISSTIQCDTVRSGDTDPDFNQGLAFWARLNRTILKNMAASAVPQSGDESQLVVQPETLLGLAAGLSKQINSDYVDDTVKFIERSALLGHIPAQGICAQVLVAHHKNLPSNSMLKEWERNSLEDGFSFVAESGHLSAEEVRKSKDIFRQKGGHCRDGFTTMPNITGIAAGTQVRPFITTERGSNDIMDLEGNTIMHAMAALGGVTSLAAILHEFPQKILATNDNGETILYKACQAGQIDILQLIKKSGCELVGMSTHREGITSLHWLFVFAEDDIDEACKYLVGPHQEYVNSGMASKTNSSDTLYHNHFPITHFPFELPYGTALHWACATRNFVAMKALIKHGARIDALCYNKHPHSTPLSLAVYFGDVEVALFLIEHGANAQVVDPKNRTLLHRIPCFLPELHGSCPHQWHYWIRHGHWEHHKSKMLEMVTLLQRAGVDLEACSTTYTPLTALLTATAPGESDGGAVFALIKGGADLNNAKGTCKDSVLISWCGITSERLYYPSGYAEILEAIVLGTNDLSYTNDQKKTAFHIVASLDTSREQFKSSMFTLLPSPETHLINLKDRDMNTPLLLSLMRGSDAIFRAEVLIDQGADMCVVNDCGDNIFGVVTGNKDFMDADSASNIKTLLGNNSSAEFAFKQFENSSKCALWNASKYARPETLKLLLDLGMSSHVNEVDSRYRQSSQKTALDHALDYGEASRMQHIKIFARHGASFDPKLLESSFQLYDAKQGGAERAREAYWAFPSTIKILKEHGAKRAWELGPQYSCENIEQPGEFDLNNIFTNGFSADTQPHRKHWSILYELAKYTPDWKQNQLDALIKHYENETYRPLLKVLQNWPELCEELGRKNEYGWIRIISAEDAMIEVRMTDGEIMESRDLKEDRE